MKKALPLILFTLFLLGVPACDDHTKPNLPPIVVIAANPLSGSAPLIVSFTSSAEDSDGLIASYCWNFGDGIGTSTQQNPSYTYNTTGTFTATCTVSDNGKQPLTASATVVITVYQSKIPTLNSISPDWSVIHMPEFTMTATGTDFIPQSLIVFDGKEMVTTYISPAQLRCNIRPDDTVLSSAVNSDGFVNLEADQYTGVLVRNPGTGGGDSSALRFTVKPDYTFSGSFMVSKWSEINHIKIFIEKYIYVHYTFEEYYMRCSVDKGVTWEDERRMPDYYHVILGAHEYNLATDGSGAFYWIYPIGNTMYMMKTINKGVSWSDPVMIYAGTPYTGGCQIKAQDANIVSFGDSSLYAVWMEYLDGGCSDFDIWLASSSDRGNTWGTPVKLTPSDFSYYPVLFRNKNSFMHLFYYLSPSGQLEGPRHAWSTDGGAHWTSGTDIYPDVLYSADIPYVGHNNGLYLPEIKTVGSDQEIGFKYSKDGGSTWSDFIGVIILPSSQVITNISFVEDTVGNINVFYTCGSSDTSTALWHERSIDEGKTWSQPQKISPWSYKTYQSMIDCDAAGNLYVLYYYAFRNFGIYFTSSERNQ